MAAMLQLLQDVATDTEEPCDESNPLRQVIVNTHSPTVFQQVPEGSVLMAELVEDVRPDGGQGKTNALRFRKLPFSCLEDTWRARRIKEHRITGKGNLLACLNPSASVRDKATGRTRVMDHNDIQLLLTMPSEG
jgi:hypothetical protein